MAETKKDTKEAVKAAEKSADPKEPSPTPAALVIPAEGGAGTATAAARRAESDKERIANLETRGAPEEPLGDPQSDYPENDTKNKPQGLQAEPATFVANGSVEGNYLPSPTGPVPVGAVAGSREEAKALREAHAKRLETEQRRGAAFDHLEDEQIDQMDGATLRAVAQQRGYGEPPASGTRTAREFFRQKQSEDKRLAKGGK